MNPFYYKCKGCGATWAFEEGAGWVDDHGNFGRRAHPDGAIKGTPKGEWEPVTFIEKLCMSCNGKYTVLSGNVHSYPVKPLQVPSGETVELHLVNNASTCPVCKVPMYSGRELLDHVINRDRCSKFMLARLPSTMSFKCPACKAEYLRYDNTGGASCKS